MSKPFPPQTLRERIADVLGLAERPSTIPNSELNDLNEMLGDILQAVDEAMEQVIAVGNTDTNWFDDQQMVRSKLRAAQRTRKKAILEDPATLNNNKSEVL